MEIGDKIAYKNINLSDVLRFPKIGLITKIEKSPNGGDCLIKWNHLTKETEECLSNLKLINSK